MMIMLIISRICNLLSFEVPMIHPKDQDSLFSYIFQHHSSTFCLGSMQQNFSKVTLSLEVVSRTVVEWSATKQGSRACKGTMRYSTSSPNDFTTKAASSLKKSQISLTFKRVLGEMHLVTIPKNTKVDQAGYISQRVKPFTPGIQVGCMTQAWLLLRGSGKAATNSSSLIPPT